MTSIRESKTSQGHHERSDDKEDVEKQAPLQAEVAQLSETFSQPPAADHQDALSQAIRDGKSERIVSLLAHTDVSLNHRDVTHDLQTPLMRLCHAHLQPIPAAQAHPHSEGTSSNNRVLLHGDSRFTHVASHASNYSEPAPKATAAAPTSFTAHVSTEEATPLNTSHPVLQVIDAVDNYYLVAPPEIYGQDEPGNGDRHGSLLDDPANSDGRHERVDLDRQDSVGRTLAMHACIAHNLAVLRWALSRHCGLLVSDREGRNLLHYAACSGSDAVVDLALAHPGALKALQTLDYQGYSPLDMARQRKFSSAVKKLGIVLRSQHQCDQDSTPISSLAPTATDQRGGNEFSAQSSEFPNPSVRLVLPADKVADTQEAELQEETNMTKPLCHLRHFRAHARSIPSPRGVLANPDRNFPPAEVSQHQSKTLNPINKLQNNGLQQGYGAHYALPEQQKHLFTITDNGYGQISTHKEMIHKEISTTQNSNARVHVLVPADRKWTPLASITSRSAKDLSHDDFQEAIKSDTHSRQALDYCSRQEGVGISPPMRRSLALSVHPDINSQKNSAFGHSSPEHQLKLKNNDNTKTLAALQAPNRSPRNIPQTIMANRDFTRITTHQPKMAQTHRPPASNTPKVYVTAPQQRVEVKCGLLPKRQHNPSQQQQNTNHPPEGTVRSGNCDTPYIFEEEFVLDTPLSVPGGSKESSYTNRHSNKDCDETRGEAADSVPSSAHDDPSPRDQRRESVSLPDLHDMTGQLVTSREVSPVFQRDKTCWAVKTKQRATTKNNATEPDQKSQTQIYNDRDRGKRSPKKNMADGWLEQLNDRKHVVEQNCHMDMDGGLPTINLRASDRD